MSSIVGQIKVRVRPDTENFDKELLAKLNAIERSAKPIKVGVDEDYFADSMSRAMDRAIRSVERNVDRIKIRADIDFDHVSATRGVRAFVSSVDALSTRMLRAVGSSRLLRQSLWQIGQTGRAMTGWNVFRDINDRFDRTLENLDRIAVRTAMVSSGILHFGGNIGSVLPAIASFGVGLAEIARAGIALPGMLTGMAVGAVAFAVALSDFNRQLPGVGRRFQEMANTMRPAFWEAARRPMAEMFERLIPGIARGMTQVARQAGIFTGSLSRWMGEIMQPRLPRFFDDVARGITTATEGTQGFARAFGVLMTVGAAQLPRFGSWMTQIATQFGSFLERAERTGDIWRWVDTGVLRLRQLSAGTRDLIASFANVTNAIAAAFPGSAVEAFARNMESLRAQTGSPRFQRDLTQGFTDLRRIMIEFEEVTGPAFQAAMARTAESVRVTFGTMMDGLSHASRGLFVGLAGDGFQGGLQSMFNGIADGLRGMERFLPAVGTGLGALATIIGDLARQVLPLASQALGHVSNILDQLQPGISAFIDAVGPALSRAMLRVAPALGRIADALSPLIGRIGEAAAGLIDSLAPGLEAVANAIADKLTPEVVESLGDSFASIATSVGKLAPALESFAQAVEGSSVLEDFARDLSNLADEIEVATRMLGHFARERMITNALEQAAKDNLGEHISVQKRLNEANRLRNKLEQDYQETVTWAAQTEETRARHMEQTIELAERLGWSLEKTSSTWAEYAQSLEDYANLGIEEFGQLYDAASKLNGMTFEQAMDSYSDFVRNVEEGGDYSVAAWERQQQKFAEFAERFKTDTAEIDRAWRSYRDTVDDPTVEGFERHMDGIQKLARAFGTSVPLMNDRWLEYQSTVDGATLEGFERHIDAVDRLSQEFGVSVGEMERRWREYQGVVGDAATAEGFEAHARGVENLADRFNTSVDMMHVRWANWARSQPEGADTSIAAYNRTMQAVEEMARVHGVSAETMYQRWEQWADGQVAGADRSVEQYLKVQQGLVDLAAHAGTSLEEAAGHWERFAENQRAGKDTSVESYRELVAAAGEVQGLSFEEAMRAYSDFVESVEEGADRSIDAWREKLLVEADALNGANALMDRHIERRREQQQQLTGEEVTALEERARRMAETAGAGYAEMEAGAIEGGERVAEGFGTGISGMSEHSTTQTATAGELLLQGLAGLAGIALTGGTGAAVAFGQGLADMANQSTTAAANADANLLAGLVGLGVTSFAQGLAIAVGFGLGLATMQAQTDGAIDGARGALNNGYAEMTGEAAAGGANIGSAFANALDLLPGVNGAIGSALGVFIDGMSSMTAAGGEGGTNTSAAFAIGISPMPGVAATAANTATDNLRSGLSPMPGIGSTAGAGAASGLQSGLSPMPGIASTLGSSASSGLRAGLSPMPGIASAAGYAAASALRGTSGAFYSAGANMGASAASGLRSQMGAVAAAASAIIGAANRAARARASIASPSKVWTRFGEQMAEGLALGLDREQQSVVRSVQSLVDAATSALPDSLTLPVSTEVSTRVVGHVGGVVREPDPVGVGVGGDNINVTNYYPQAEPTSRTIARAQQLKTLR